MATVDSEPRRRLTPPVRLRPVAKAAKASALLLAALSATVTITPAPIAPLGRVARVRTIAIDTAVPPTIYAGTEHGMFVSAEQGRNWREAYKGHRVYAIAIASSPIATVFTAGDDGVRVSRDRGYSWATASFPTPPPVMCLTGEPSARRVYAGTMDGFVLRTDDQGRSWKVLRKLGDGSAILSIASAQTGSPMLVAGTVDGHVYQSLTHGDKWNESKLDRGLGSVRALAIVGKTRRVTLAGTDSGLFRQVEGERWLKVTRGMPDPGPVYGIGANLDGEGPTYAAVWGRGVFRTMNPGGEWVMVGDFPNILAIALDPLHPRTAYIGGFGGVLKTDDMGGKWTDLR